MTQQHNQMSLFEDANAAQEVSGAVADAQGQPQNLALPTLLSEWRELGWIRPLDAHFARFLDDADDAVSLAAVLVSHQLGRGHICLDLARAWEDPSGVLSLPPQDGSLQTHPVMTPSQVLDGLALKDPEAWLIRLKASSVVVEAEQLRAGTAAPLPLVVEGTRLYLYRLWNAEGDVAQGLKQRLASITEDDQLLSEQLVELFPRNPSLDQGETDWQRVACALAAIQQLAVISGGPGTGKTTTVVKLLALLQQQALAQQGRPLDICLAAPTGKAAARLSESIGGAIERAVAAPELREQIPREAMTLHRLLGARPDTRHFRHGAEHPLPLDVLVVDEASMIDLGLMQALLAALPHDARLILLGDRDQLASVEAGAVLGELCAGSEGFSEGMTQRLASICREPIESTSSQALLSDHVVTLTRSYRFDSHSGIGALARAVNRGDVEAIRACWQGHYQDLDQLVLSGEHDPALIKAAVAGLRGYLEGIDSRSPLESLQRLAGFQLLCALRRGPWGVEGLNQAIEKALVRQQLIKDNRGWYAGRPVMVTRNDPRLGLYNGDVGLTLTDPEDPARLRVFFLQVNAGEETLRGVSPGRLTDVDTAFAMTVHKSQGSEFKRVLLVLPADANPILTRELIYTGITRAREHCTIASANQGLLYSAAQRHVWRDANLRARMAEAENLRDQTQEK